MTSSQTRPAPVPYAAPCRAASPVTVALPTLGREAVLVATLQQLLAEPSAPAEILVLDQTRTHEPATSAALAGLERAGRIRWIHLAEPSVPGALNTGLRLATQPVVLFLDDDVVIVPGLVRAHATAHAESPAWAVAGGILQPGQEPTPVTRRGMASGAFADLDFPFHSDCPTLVGNAMAGNLSVKRERALALGGFDENYAPPVAYRFETDFCKRIIAAGGSILFEPRGCIHHLRHPRGGTRMQGSHLTSMSPVHGIGDYYFALCHARGGERLRYILRRPFREVATRFHLRHPWWIPVKLIGEFRALAAAIRLRRSGPKLPFSTPVSAA